MTIEDLQAQLTVPEYSQVAADAIDLINNSTGPLTVRGINSPASILVHSQAFVSQVLLESFRALTPLLALRLIQSAGVQRRLDRPATGEVTITSSVRQVVSGLRAVSIDTGVEYAQEGPAVLCLPNLPQTITMAATQPGPVGNIPATSDLLVVWQFTTDLDSASTTGLANGRLAETDAQLLERGFLALTSRGVPITQADWAATTKQLALGLDAQADPQVRVTTSFWGETFPGGNLTKPMVRIELAMDKKTPASTEQVVAIRSELSAVGLLHTQVTVAPAVIENCAAKAIIQHSSTTVPAELANHALALLSNGFSSSFQSGIVEQRRLFSALAQLQGVTVVEELWLGAPNAPLRADNCQVSGLPFLQNLELQLLSPTGQATNLFLTQ